MILTDAERERFIHWLTENADGNDGLATQASGLLAPTVLLDRLRVEAKACRIVATILQETYPAPGPLPEA